MSNISCSSRFFLLLDLIDLYCCFLAPNYSLSLARSVTARTGLSSNSSQRYVTALEVAQQAAA